MDAARIVDNKIFKSISVLPELLMHSLSCLKKLIVISMQDTKKVGYLLFSLSILLFTSCSYAPDVLRMIPETDSQYLYTDKSIELEMVMGGEGANIFKTSNIDNNPFYKALEQSLIRSNMFRSVNLDQNPDYILKTTILSHEKPFAIFTVTIKLMVMYQIQNAADGSELWSKPVKSECRKTVSDEFVGLKREQKANECAAKENIRLLLQELAQLDL